MFWPPTSENHLLSSLLKETIVARVSDSVRGAFRICLEKMKAAGIVDETFGKQLLKVAYQGKMSDEELMKLYLSVWFDLDAIHRQKLSEEDDGSGDPEEPIRDRKRPSSSRGLER